MSSHEHARQYRDYSGELSTTKINIPAITVGSIVGVLVLLTNYEGALDGITTGIASQSVITLDRTTLSAERPTNEFSQRELKWLVHYHSATLGHKFTMEIPTADPTGRLVPGTDLMDFSTDTAAIGFKTAFEAAAVAPDDDTDQCVIDYVELVGRNL
jgi:hypothetical protein